MSSVVKNLIKYEGIKPCINLSGNPKNYKQTNLDGMQNIPDCKLDIEQIVKVWGKINIEHHEVIETPIGTSIEGQHLTGSKMLIVGDVKLKIEYVACDEDRGVHSAHIIVPFCEYIVLPEGGCHNYYMYPESYIEDISVNLLDPRTFFYNIMILFVAKVC